MLPERQDVAVTAIGVVIVTDSPGETLERFLDSLAKATSRQVRVVLADNGSTDGAPERAAVRPEVTLMSTGGNLGYGGGADRWVAALPAEIGCLVVARSGR